MKSFSALKSEYSFFSFFLEHLRIACTVSAYVVLCPIDTQYNEFYYEEFLKAFNSILSLLFDSNYCKQHPATRQDYEACLILYGPWVYNSDIPIDCIEKQLEAYLKRR